MPDVSANTWAASGHATPDIEESNPHGNAGTRPILLIGRGVRGVPSTISIPIVIVLNKLRAVSNSIPGPLSLGLPQQVNSMVVGLDCTNFYQKARKICTADESLVIKHLHAIAGN